MPRAGLVTWDLAEQRPGPRSIQILAHGPLRFCVGCREFSGLHLAPKVLSASYICLQFQRPKVPYELPPVPHRSRLFTRNDPGGPGVRHARSVGAFRGNAPHS